MEGTGLGVSEGSGVKVRVLVGVIVSVGVVLGAEGVAVSVIGEKAVFVGMLLSERLGWTAVGFGVLIAQADEVRIHKMVTTIVRLIDNIYFSFRIIYTNDNEVTRLI